MPRRRLHLLVTVALCVAAAAVLSSCSFGGKSLSASVNQAGKSDPNLIKGGTLFQQRCGTCHTLEAAGTEGTTANKADRERVDGPNLNARFETKDQVLYAIRNGGFSGAIMPQNIVTAQEADAVAAFVAKYAGAQAKRAPTPGQPAPSGS